MTSAVERARYIPFPGVGDGMYRLYIEQCRPLTVYPRARTRFWGQRGGGMLSVSIAIEHNETGEVKLVKQSPNNCKPNQKQEG